MGESKVYPLGDLHVGAAGFDEAGFVRRVKSIKDDPSAYWLGMGDYCDFITHTDRKRFDARMYAEWMYTPDNLADPGTAQRDVFLDLTRPIWDRCLGLIEGNHEATMLKWQTRDIYREMCATIGAVASPGDPRDMRLGRSSWLLLRFRREGIEGGSATAKVWAFHGFGGGRLKGADALKQQRFAWTHPAHMIVTAHVHKEMAFPEYYEDVDRAGNVRTVPIRTIISGPWKGHGPWEEAMGFFPSGTGSGYAHFRPWLKVNGERGFHLRDALEIRGL